MIGDRLIEIIYYDFLSLRLKKYYLYSLESQSLLDVFTSFSSKPLPQYYQPSKDKGWRVVFRSSSLQLTKIFYKTSWGNFWFCAFFIALLLSWLASFTVRLSWIYISYSLPYHRILSRFVYSLISERDHASFQKMLFEHFSPTQSDDVSALVTREKIQSDQKRRLKLSYSLVPSLQQLNHKYSSSPGFDTSKIVVIIIRTSHYLNDPDNIRNSNIESYLDLASALTKHGYSPIFIGSYSPEVIEKINAVADHISRLHLPSFYDEICLVRDCHLFIKSATGPQALSLFFGKKTLSVDTFPYVYDWESRGSFYIPKYIYSDNLCRYLTPEEMFNLQMTGASDHDLRTYFSDNKLKPVNLSTNHLISAALECLQLKPMTDRDRLVCSKVKCQHDQFTESSLRQSIASSLSKGSLPADADWLLRLKISEGLPSLAFANSLGKPWSP